MMGLPREVLMRYVARSAWFSGREEPPRAWLCPREQVEFGRIRDAQRRQQWLAARRVAKQLVQEISGAADLREIQIMARDDRGRGISPQIVVGTRRSWSLSISHTARGLAVALAATDRFTVGVDLAADVPLGAGFQQLWFTPQERCWLSEDPLRRSATLWAIKEAVFKAANRGQAWSPRQVEVCPARRGGWRCVYAGRPVSPLWLDVREIDGQVAALACRTRAADAADLFRVDSSAATPTSSVSPRADVMDDSHSDAVCISPLRFVSVTPCS